MSHSPSRSNGEGAELDRRFEGRARLQALLEAAGASADVKDVAEAFVTAQRAHLPAAKVINALFEDEPRFSSPNDARALFGNLFGLWELLQQGAPLDLCAPAAKLKHSVVPTTPGFFPKEGPDAQWLQRASRYLEAAPARERQRLQHAYDHRTDRLVTWLDEQGLSELGFAFAQHLLFELFALLELGSQKGIGAVEAPRSTDEEVWVPPALAAYTEETLDEAEHDQQEPLAHEEARRLHSLMGLALSALWTARKER